MTGVVSKFPLRIKFGQQSTSGKFSDRLSGQLKASEVFTEVVVIFKLLVLPGTASTVQMFVLPR